MQPIAWSAEFPNDNPLLHDGAVWICTTVRGAPRAVLRARASVPPPPPVPIPVPVPVPVAPEPEPVVEAQEPVVEAQEPVVEAQEPAVEPLKPLVSAEPEPVLAPEPDPFQELVAAITEVVLEAGATRAAASVPALLDGQQLGADSFCGENLELLLARGLLERGPSGVAPSAALAATSGAWRRVLRGELADLTDCGTATLDSWASELAAALIGAPLTRCDDLRRQLRRRGVAAFGMLAKAA